MGKFLFGVLFFLGLAGFLFYKFFYGDTIFSKGTINFSVQEFSDKDVIPKKFTCDGQDISPSFIVERVPGDAESLVIVIEDKDTASVFTHYILYNIGPEVGTISQNSYPPGSVVGTNDFGKTEYNGPCLSVGSHKYVFRVYALDKMLTLEPGAKRADLDTAMKGHIIAHGEYSGSYSKE